MSVYRCNHCGYLAEESAAATGQKMPCARCGQPVTVYGTVFFIEKVLERYAATLRELKALKAIEAQEPPPDAPEAATTPNGRPASQAETDTDFHNTRELATASQHAPLAEWFKARKIQATFDYAAVDTTGYFDDAALQLGTRFELLAPLLDHLCWAYRKNVPAINVELGKLPQKDGQAINKLCREFYSHTLFARYYYQKPEKVIRLTLQPASTVRRFFEGGWLEWFALMQGLRVCQQRHVTVAAARGAKLTFGDEDLHELDVVLLPQQGQPVVIECKSGEFRREIDKYSRLRKRLGLDRARFILFAPDLRDEQTASLGAMYELSFANLHTLPGLLQALL